ncbi:GGDEF domain-containing protein [Ollibium composti]|uniref:diguanylate cyclase n=1 Tax=Ollibium composti TaxID=2675109 RepID=A0ABY2Q6X5_9HYPH|nr:GGDEF domain-containing protein [Mesorhizobium composti]THF57379.1 GGDEF domain-containing protein [Mesorhizobium composti]
MDSRLLIALLNPSIALVLATAFSVLWFYQRQRRYLAVLATGYVCAASGFLLQYFILPFGFTATKLISNIGFLAAGSCIAGAIIARSGRRVPFAAIGVLALGGLASLCWFMFVFSNITWRIFAINFALGGISLLAAAELRHVRRNGPIETVLLVFSLVASANFFVRTVLVIGLHGAFADYEDFYRSTYWTTALLSHAVLSLLLALTLLSAAALDVVTTLSSDARTDPLSRLFNRRGFEERAAVLLDRCDRAGMPVALVLADLDHFKAINDIYGHQAGDRVIADFAGRLQQAAGSRGVAGRLGGEEFALILPGTDLAAARMLAEAVRVAFSSGMVDGLPSGVRITASFGVASRSGNEPLEPMMRRADEALYKAKQNGRDSVRMSYERPYTAPELKLAG